MCYAHYEHTHLSSYLFVFNISCFDTHSHMLSHSFAEQSQRLRKRWQDFGSTRAQAPRCFYPRLCTRCVLLVTFQLYIIKYIAAAEPPRIYERLSCLSMLLFRQINEWKLLPRQLSTLQCQREQKRHYYQLNCNAYTPYFQLTVARFTDIRCGTLACQLCCNMNWFVPCDLAIFSILFAHSPALINCRRRVHEFSDTLIKHRLHSTWKRSLKLLHKYIFLNKNQNAHRMCCRVSFLFVFVTLYLKL